MRTRIAADHVKLKRAYEPPAPEDGTRILIDRLWPRGLSKEAAAVDLWMKDIAPTTELRKWFAHDPARWEEFRHRYADEVHRNIALFDQLGAVLIRPRRMTGSRCVSVRRSIPPASHSWVKEGGRFSTNAAMPSF